MFNSLAAGLLPITSLAQGTDFPTRPIRLVLPYAPGGPTDAIARAVARKLEVDLKVPVIVENKPGAQGVIAALAVLSSNADGYTVGWTPSPVLTTNRIALPKLPYKVDDFKLVTPLYRGGMVIAVSAATKATTLRQYLDEAKASGQPLIYGTAGPGGNSHLTVELLAQMAGLNTQMVPYKGDNPMVVDMLGGNLPAMIATVAATEQHYRKGGLKLLAFTGDQRMKELPEVPTLIESGFAIESYFWAGATHRAGTPDAVAAKLRAALDAAMHSPEVRSVMTTDLVPYVRGEQEFHKMVDSEYQRWSQVAAARGIQFK
jgi:tripartite-type tricarboxylate transporter receptor subunit TctC